MLTLEQKQKIVQFWYETHSYVKARRMFQNEFQLHRSVTTPDNKSIWRIVKHFEKEQTVHNCNKARSGTKPTITAEKRQQIKESVVRSPKIVLSQTGTRAKPYPNHTATFHED